MDAATGLLYAGNGQYYDPTTGRFLDRSNPNSTNPYVPWGGNPSAAFMAPLVLLPLLYSRGKKGSKWATFLVVLLFSLTAGLYISACGPALSSSFLTFSFAARNSVMAQATSAKLITQTAY